MSELTIFADFEQTHHVQGAGHPERPERLEVLFDLLGELEIVPELPANVAESEALLSVHTEAHVEQLLALEGESAVFDPDTRVGPTTIGAARSAAGCGLAAVNAVMSGASPRAFSIVRPPGHHAEADRAMGFCYFNNVAIMAEAARRAGAGRILIVDWDVHHGNGTQHSFESRSDVAVINLHQFPFYPGSGALREIGQGDGRGYTVNCPMSAGAGDAGYVTLFDEVVAAFARSFNPDVILVSAGYDAHVRDPLGAMRVTDAGFGQMAARLRSLADELCDGRLVATLEGGYDLTGLSGGVAATVAAWMDAATEMDAAETTSSEVADIVAYHREHTL